MKRFLFAFLCTLCSFSICNSADGQVTVTNFGSTTPNLSPTYTSLANAITALNAITAISGPVTISLDAGNPQTAPAGGYVINFATITNTVASPITITGSNNTITAFSPQIPGLLTDAIFKIIGADYITIQNFIMQENSANTATTLASNNMTEWGVALLYKTNTNGAQNNTIQNNTISLNKTYVNTFGIYSNVRHNSTAVGTIADIANGTTAPNKGNKVYGNAISNVNMGITFIGSAIDANMDTDNDIGGVSFLTGNSVTNWGSSALSNGGYVSNPNPAYYYCIFINHQKNENVSYNTVISGVLNAASGDVKGISKAYLNGLPTGTITSNITNNIITITDNISSPGILCAIYTEGITSALPTATFNINANQLLNISVAAASTYHTLVGIYNTSSVGVINVNNNIIRGTSSAATGGAFIGISNSATVTKTININYNSIGDNLGNAINFTSSTAANINAITSIFAGAATNISVSNNNFQGFVQSTGSTGLHTYIEFAFAPTIPGTANINNNTFTNITANTSGSIKFINKLSYPGMTQNAGANLYCTNNRIVTQFSKTRAGGNVSLYYSTSILSLSGNTILATGNDFSNISITGNTIMDGWRDLEGGNASCPKRIISNNIFKNWICGSSSVNAIQTDYAGDNTNVSLNTISNISGSGNITGILIGPNNRANTQTYSNNIINNLSSSGGAVTGISGGSANVTTLNINSNTLYTLSGAGSSKANGISITANGTICNVATNKMYGINSQSAGGSVYGIELNSASTNGVLNITNNFIGALTAPLCNNILAIRGIGITTAGLSSTFNIHYNTIHLNSTSTGANFGTSAVYLLSNATTTTGNTSLRNNILVNKSVANGTGFTSAIRRSASDLANYSTASNNNLLYAGTPSAKNLIYYDGTNSDQTIGAYQTRVTPRDNFSLSSLPNFTSVTGSDPNFLHLATTGNCGIANGGDNAGILLSTDYDGEIRNTISPFITDIGADEVSKLNVWTGASTSWNSSSNWSLGVVPDATDVNVYIPSAPVNQPSIAPGETFGVSNLILQSGASVTNLGTIRIAEKIYAAAGSINNMPSATIEGSLEINGGCPVAQALQGNLFVNNNLKNFRIGKNVSISSASGEGLNISRELSFGATGTTLTTGNNLTLLSSADATANVADVTGNSIAGNVTVERYVNTGLASGQHLRSWQFVATPVAGQTIFDSWQEGGLIPPAMPLGLGTIISGPTGGNFDATDLNNPSLKYYDASLGTSGSFVNITNTVAPLYDQRGYFLFVRGDRTANALNSTPTPTRLRSKGPLFQPVNPPPVTTVLAGRPASVGNPYASAIDLNYMKNNGLFVGLNNDVIVWDPWLPGSQNVGGYQTLSAANNYIPTAGGTPYYPAGVPCPFMQSGQAFFVQSSGAGGSVTFTEACKSANNTLLLRAATVTDRHYFRANLISNTGNIADGNATVFGSNYQNSIDVDDAVKMLNPAENFIIARQNKSLAVEARATIGQADTIFYTFNNLLKQTYQLSFAPQQMAEPGLHALLVDNYLSKTVSLSLSENSLIKFDVTDDPLSYRNRFFVAFVREAATVDAKLKGGQATGFIVYPNPVENNTINIRFVQPVKGTYKLQLVNTAGQLIWSGSTKTDGHGFTHLLIPGTNLTAGNYELIISGKDGSKTVEQIIVQ